MNSNTGILLIGFNRPENTLSQINYLLANQIFDFHVSVDFYDESTANFFLDNFNSLLRNRLQCQKFTFNIQNKNLGMVEHIYNAIDDRFKEFEQMLIFEDDVLLHVNTIADMIRALSKFKDYQDFGAICSYSYLLGKNFIFRRFANLWRRSIYFSCWGWGTTRDIWLKYSTSLDPKIFLDNSRNMTNWNKLSKQKKLTWIGRLNKTNANPNRTWDIQFQMMLFKLNKVVYTPIFNTSGNTGFGDSRSAHTKEKRPFWVHDFFIQRKMRDKLMQNTLITNFLQKIDSFTVGGDSNIIKFVSKIRNLKLI